MNDIDRDVDDVVFAEMEEALMMEAEIERSQLEAEIALNTRVDGDVLLPFFGNTEEMLSTTPAHTSLRRDLEDEVLDERTDGFDGRVANPFSVMTSALWKTLREPMSCGKETTDVETGTGLL